MLNLLITRDKWVRGQSGIFGKSRLLNNKGNMCCLGFLGKTCGVPVNEMLDKVYPIDLGPEYTKLFPEGLKGMVVDFIRSNDSGSEKTREETLKELFLTIGVTVEFVD